MSRQTVVMKIRSAWKPEVYEAYIKRTLQVVHSASLLCQEVGLYWTGFYLWALQQNEPLPPFTQTMVDNIFSAVAGTNDVKEDTSFRAGIPTPDEDRRILNARAEVERATRAAQPLTNGKKRKKQPAPNIDPNVIKLSEERTSAEEQQRRAGQCRFKVLLARFHPSWPRSGTDYRNIPCKLREHLRITMLTNAQNSLFMPYYGRQSNVLRWQMFAPTPENRQRMERWATVTNQTKPHDAGVQNRLRAHIQACINGSGKSEPGDELFQDIVAQHRAYALFRLQHPISDKLLKANGGLVLTYYRYLLYETHRAQDQRQAWLEDATFPFKRDLRLFRLRVFSLLPLRSYKHIHIPLTRTTLKAIYKKKLALADLLDPKWKNCTFMSTDGVRCHLGFDKGGEKATEGQGENTNKKRRRPPKNQKTKNDMISLFDHKVGLFMEHLVQPEVGRDRKLNVVGIDPGRTTLVQASSGYSLSKGRYYNECGFVAVEDRRNQYLTNLSPEQQGSRTAAESLSFKLWDWNQFRAHWMALIPHREAKFQIYGATCLTEDRFWSYRRKQKCMATMAKKLFSTSKTVLAFGNGQFPTSYKGARAGPGASLAKYLSKRGRVVMIDEFRTSMQCNRCHHEQENVPIKTAIKVKQKAIAEEEKGQRFNYLDRKVETWRKTRKKRDPEQFKETKTEVHAVLWCQHCTEKHGQNVFRNRDVNASRNMRDLLQWHLSGEGRPAVFCRTRLR